MTQSAVSIAADYADAMMTARKAKNVLFTILLVMLLVQLSLFFTVRYRFGALQPSPAVDLLKYLTGGLCFLGVIVPLVLCTVLLLIVMIMLVGRLIGVSRLVAAFLWCVLLTVLLFPWQAILINQTFTSTDFKIPGILYTWAELSARAQSHPGDGFHMLLFWARFVGFPVAAIAIALIVQTASRRGLRLALGELSAEPIEGEPNNRKRTITDA